MNEPLEVVRDHLSRGVTGCLALPRPDGGGALQLYVMQGEIIAAHSPDDGPAVVRRLINGGAISEGLAREILAAVDDGASFEGELLGRVAEDLFLDLLVQRFRQNVLEFISADVAVTFSPMEAVFVENIQTGHDSQELLATLAAQREIVAELQATSTEQVARPGDAAPTRQVHARILDLCDPGLRLDALLQVSPFEDGATLAAIAEMSRSGAIVLEPFVAQEEPELEIEEGSIIPELEVEEETQEVLPSGLDLLDIESTALEPISEEAISEDFGDASGDADPGHADDDDPEVAHAIRRAQEIEARRAAAREGMERDQEGGVTTTPVQQEERSGGGATPPGFEWAEETGGGGAPPGFDFGDDLVPEDELAFFEDQDRIRGRGDGKFTTENELLDRVDLSEEGMAAFRRAMGTPTDEPAAPKQHDIIELGEASADEAQKAVALSFSGPRLDEQDILHKLEVVNDVLSEVAGAIDASGGRGQGRVGLQLLVDGPPSRYAPVFRGVQLDGDGRMDTKRILRNLKKRPESERRRLLRESMMDLIQRTLSTSLEQLEDEQIDTMLENIAGYQQRMGL